jgi:hypothetical protein
MLLLLLHHCIFFNYCSITAITRHNGYPLLHALHGWPQLRFKCFCCCLLADLCLLLHFLQPGCEGHNSLLKLHTAQPNTTAPAAAAATAAAKA